jgi:hypothetical protein
MEVEEYEISPHHHPQAPELLMQLYQEAAKYTELPTLAIGKHQENMREKNNIKERKWSQISALLDCVRPTNTRVIVDWCCGKGHLGRTFANRKHKKLIGVEVNAELCKKGQQLAFAITPTFICCNVFDTVPDFPSESTFLALHSCGDLGDKALQIVVQQNATSLYLVPCCHHKISTDTRYPLSQIALQSGLLFTKAELMIPSTFETVSPKRHRRRRRQEMRYRIALDLMLRDVEGRTTYRSFSSVPDAWKELSFVEFVKQMQNREGFSIPMGWKKHDWEERGRDKLRQIRAVASVRSLFSRAIEVWQVLDKALWLEEKGWHVELGTFCSPEISPRNILLRGVVRDQSGSLLNENIK